MAAMTTTELRAEAKTAADAGFDQYAATLTDVAGQIERVLTFADDLEADYSDWRIEISQSERRKLAAAIRAYVRGAE